MIGVIILIISITRTQIKTWSLPDYRICPSFASLLYVKSTILLELGDAPHACYCKPSLKGAPVPVSPHDFWFGDFSDVSLVFKDIFLPRLTSLLTPSDPSSDFWFKIYISVSVPALLIIVPFLFLLFFCPAPRAPWFLVLNIKLPNIRVCLELVACWQIFGWYC